MQLQKGLIYFIIHIIQINLCSDYGPAKQLSFGKVMISLYSSDNDWLMVKIPLTSLRRCTYKLRFIRTPMTLVRKRIIPNVITKRYSQLTRTFVWLLSNKTTFDYLLLKFRRCQNRSWQCLSKVKTLTAIRTSLCPHTPATVQLMFYWKHKYAENYYSWREGYFSSELLWTKFLKLEFTSRDNMVALKGCNN